MVVPPRYDRGDWGEEDGMFNTAVLAAYTRKLADASNDTFAPGTSRSSSAGSAPSRSGPR